MKYETYSHRFADIILNSEYQLRREIEEVLKAVDLDCVSQAFREENQRRQACGKRLCMGRQAVVNALLKREFQTHGWETEKVIFNDPGNDLVMDLFKRRVGVDVAFDHRSYLGGDLLRFQAASEVTRTIDVGVYICPTRSFSKEVSPDGRDMVSFERAKWYLKSFSPVFTVPVYLIGLSAWDA